MKQVLIAAGVTALTVGLHSGSTGAVSGSDEWAKLGTEKVQSITGVINAHCPGCTFSSPVDGNKNSADPFVAGTSAGGNIGGFIAEGPDGEQRLVFCSDAVTPTTNTAGGVVQLNVSGSLQYLLWKYSEFDGTLPANTGPALQSLVWMYGSDAQNRSEVWKADGASFTPENWDTKDPWATDNRVGFAMADPQYPIYSIVTDGAEATLITKAQDFGHPHTIAADDTVTVTGSANAATNVTVVTVAAATDPTYVVTDATRDGTTATATLGALSAGSGAYTFQVGDSVTIAGSTDFNGTHTLTAVAVDGSTISWADTGAATTETGITATADVDPGWDSVITFATTAGAGTETPADATLTVQGAHDATVAALDARTRALYLEGISNAAPWSLTATATGVTLMSAADNPIEGHTITVSAPGEDAVELITDANGAVVWPETWADPGYSTTWSATAVTPGSVWEIRPSNYETGVRGQTMLITGEDGSTSDSWTSDPAPTTTTVAPPTTTTVAPATTTTIAATTTTVAPTTTTTTTVVVPPTFPATGVDEEGYAMSLQIALWSTMIGLGAGGLALAARRK